MQKVLYLHEINDLYTSLCAAPGFIFPENIRYAAGKNRRLLKSFFDASEEVRVGIAEKYTPDEKIEENGKSIMRKKMKDNGASYDMFDFNSYNRDLAKYLGTTDTVDLHCIPLADLNAVKEIGQGLYTAMLTMTNEEPGLSAETAAPAPVPTKPAMKAKT